MTTNNTNRRLATRLVAVSAVGAIAAVAFGTAIAAPAGADAPQSASVSAGTLTVTGTEGADRIALLLAAGAPSTLQVDFGDDGTIDAAFDRSTFTSIDVDGRNGDDHVRVNQVNGAFADETITIRGGNGDDVLEGGDGNELLVGGPGNDFVDGNHGTDTGILGSGDDTFQWDPGDGSDVVEGSSGSDTLAFNGAAGVDTMRLTADGNRALFLRTQGTIRMDLNRVERVAVAAVESADALIVDDLSGTDVTDVDVDLAGPAGGGDAAVDTVTINGTVGDDVVDVSATNQRVDIRGLAATTHIFGEEVADRLQLRTLDGDDRVDVTDAAAALMTVGVDLGSGQL